MGIAAAVTVTAAGTSLLPAVFGLLGVLLGGIVTIAGNLLVQRSRERAEQEAQEHDAEAGMRVVAVQLDDIEQAARSIGELGSWVGFADAEGWLATWEEERKRIAAAFSRDGQGQCFDVVARAFLVAKLFRAATERREGDDVDERDRAYLDGVRSDVADASGVLRRVLEAGGAAEA